MTTQTGAARTVQATGLLERRFRLKDRGSNSRNEVRGGLVTFLTMAYIVVLNPLIMGTMKDSTGHYLGGGTAPNLVAVAVATAVVAGVMTVAMGLFANYPLALATGLGLVGFVTFTVVPTMTWADAMGLIVLEGIIMLILVLTGFRVAIFDAVPFGLKKAISVGIGLFIAFVGLVDGGIVHKAPSVPVQLGIDGSLQGWPTLVFVVGLLTIIVLWVRKVHASILWGIIVATVLAVVIEAVGKIGGQTNAAGEVVNPTGWSLNVPEWPSSVFTAPDFSSMFHVSFGSFATVGVLASVVVIFTMLLTNLFDTVGTMTAIGDEAGLLDENGTPPNAKAILVVDSAAGAAGGLGGVSSATAYIESASGVGAGARTGLSSVVVGVLFLLSIVVAPLVTIVPYEAATPALVFVGFLMMQQIRDIDWKELEIAIPAFLTIILMPLTYSISNGIGAGFITFVVIKLALGKARDIHWVMWIVTVAFVAYFLLSPLKSWLGIG